MHALYLPLIAQVPSLGGRAAGLLGQVAAALALVAVAWLTVILYWKLLVAAVDAPSAGKLATIVVVPLAAAFFVGATPDLIDAAYTYGQSFMEGG